MATKAKKHDDYDQFVEKFKPKLTTDDCYTPPLVYEAVANHVAEHYSVPRGKMIRPFWNGADYKAADYSCGAVVVDNPPFSILGEIIDYYTEREIKFFLFAPSLTALSYVARPGVTAVISNSKIVYENGAKIITAFLTSLSPDLVAATAPALSRAIASAVQEIAKSKAKQLPRYEYPPQLITAAKLKLAADSVIEIPRAKSAHVRTLDAQRAAKKAVFGSGLLVSDDVATAIDLAVKNRGEKKKELGMSRSWQLSQRELEIISNL